jgi:hypothetical protein
VWPSTSLVELSGARDPLMAWRGARLRRGRLREGAAKARVKIGFTSSEKGESERIRGRRAFGLSAGEQNKREVRRKGALVPAREKRRRAKERKWVSRSGK